MHFKGFPQCYFCKYLPSVLWHCWLGSRKDIRPVKNWKIQTGFTFLVPAHPGSPGQRAVKHVCVCTSANSRTFPGPTIFRDVLLTCGRRDARRRRRERRRRRQSATGCVERQTTEQSEARSPAEAGRTGPSCRDSAGLAPRTTRRQTRWGSDATAAQLLSQNIHHSHISDWLVVLRPTRHKIGHFGDVSPANLLAWYAAKKN